MSLFGNNPDPRRRARSTNSERARQNRKAISIGLASLAALGVFAAIVLSNKSDPIDAHTGCKLGSAVPDAHTIMLIDQTDTLTEDQLYYVKTLILREYLRLNRYERFTLVGLKSLGDANGQNPAHAFQFSRCRVQMGAEADSLTQSPALLNARFNQLVGQDLAKVIDGLSSIPRGASSPIIETLDNLASGVLFASPQIKRRLVIVSDMVQNSPRLSQFSRAGYVYVFRDLNGLHSRSSLAGMQVRVHYVLRDDFRNVQTPDHRRFWAAYFKVSGADDELIGWGLPPDTATGSDEITPIVETEMPSLAQTGSAETWSDEISTEPPNKAAPAMSGEGASGNQPLRPLEPTAPPAAIRVNTTLAQRYIRYEVNWPVKKELAFDARRVLLLTLNQPGCYVTIPLATLLTKDAAGAGVSDGTVIRRLATYEPSEMDFAQRLPLSIDVSTSSISFCEAVGVRVQRGANSGLRYRAVRCGGQSLKPIDDLSWRKIASATARGAVRLGVLDGEHQLQQDYVEKVRAALRDKTLCASAGDVSLDKKITLGLGWLNESSAPPEPGLELAPEPEPELAPEPAAQEVEYDPPE